MRCEHQIVEIARSASGPHLGSGPDPIIDAIAEFRTIDAEMERLHAVVAILKLSEEFEAESARLGDLRDNALRKVYETEPLTRVGLLGLVRLFMDEDLPALGGIEGAGAEAVCNAVLALVPE